MTLLLNKRRSRRAHPSATPRSYALLCGCTGDTLCDACALPTAALLSDAVDSTN